MLPGGSSPRPPFFSLRSVRCHWYSSMAALIEHPGPTDLLASHRTFWGILPQTPVFSLRSASCHWHSSITVLTEHPGPKGQLVNHRTFNLLSSGETDVPSLESSFSLGETPRPLGSHFVRTFFAYARSLLICVVSYEGEGDPSDARPIRRPGCLKLREVSGSGR